MCGRACLASCSLVGEFLCEAGEKELGLLQDGKGIPSLVRQAECLQDRAGAAVSLVLPGLLVPCARRI